MVRGMLMKLQDEWAECVSSSTTCPLAFTEEDKTWQREDEKTWSKSIQLKQDLPDETGEYRGWTGCVNHNDYETMRARLDRCSEDFIRRQSITNEEQHQWLKVWPFKDSLTSFG